MDTPVKNDEARSTACERAGPLRLPIEGSKNGQLNRICAIQRLPLLLAQYLLEYLLGLP